MWILEEIRGLASEYPLALNVLTSPKHGTSTPKRSFTQRVIHSNLDNARKSHFLSYLKCLDCL